MSKKGAKGANKTPGAQAQAIQLSEGFFMQLRFTQGSVALWIVSFKQRKCIKRRQKASFSKIR